MDNIDMEKFKLWDKLGDYFEDTNKVFNKYVNVFNLRKSKTE
jgi:hypothetical protein